MPQPKLFSWSTAAGGTRGPIDASRSSSEKTASDDDSDATISDPSFQDLDIKVANGCSGAGKMAPKTDEKSIEVRDSIEAKGTNDEDVDMEDAENQMDVDADADADADAEGEEDADGEPDDAAPSRSSKGPRDLVQVIENTSNYLCNYTEEYVSAPALPWGPHLKKPLNLTMRC